MEQYRYLVNDIPLNLGNEIIKQSIKDVNSIPTIQGDRIEELIRYMIQERVDIFRRSQEYRKQVKRNLERIRQTFTVEYITK